MNEILEQLEKRYHEVRNEETRIAIELSLARQGIDPARVAKMDMDQILRGNRKIEQIQQKANEKHLQIQTDTETEIIEVHNELVKTNQKICKEQGIDGSTPGAESEPDHTAAPQSDSPPV